jgi:hypothetical protein
VGLSIFVGESLAIIRNVVDLLKYQDEIDCGLEEEVFVLSWACECVFVYDRKSSRFVPD